MDWSNLKADYERLGTYKAVAAEYGVSVSTVGQYARRQGINRGYAIQDSPLEKLLQAALRKAGVGFTTQAFVAGRFFADILLHQAPVILEADGHWHKVRQAEDANRDAAIVADGYRIFRFTGAQINRGAEDCVRHVMETCGLEPDAEPEFVIRTSMMGAENPNWTGGPQAVPCEQCGAETTRNAYRLNMKKRFCNSKCYGAWLTDHPEAGNRRLRVDWSELPALYADGVPFAQLAAKYGCGLTTLYRQLERMGVTEKRHNPKVPTISKLSDEHRAALRRGWEKRRESGKQPSRQNGRFVQASTAEAR